MRQSSRLAATAVATVLLATPAPDATPPPPQEEVRIVLPKSVLFDLLRSATPYSVQLGSGLIGETLTFSDPADLALEGTRIRFSVRCRGTPFPVDQILRPVLRVRTSAAGGHEGVVESLPLEIPGFGRVDLKDAFPPVDLGSLFRQTVFLQNRPAVLEARVRRIEILPTGIEVRASLLLDRAAPQRDDAPAPRGTR
jgi:hypothetical protein